MIVRHVPTGRIGRIVDMPSTFMCDVFFLGYGVQSVQAYHLVPHGG